MHSRRHLRPDVAMSAARPLRSDTGGAARRRHAVDQQRNYCGSSSDQHDTEAIAVAGLGFRYRRKYI